MARPPPEAGHVSTARTVTMLCLLAALSSAVRAQNAADVAISAFVDTTLPEQQPLQQQVAAQQGLQQPSIGAAAVGAAAVKPRDFTTSLGNLFRAAEALRQNDAYVILDVTNTYRKKHEAPPLAWSPTLASSAAKWAAKCTFEADPSNRAGESVFASSAAEEVSDTVIAAVNTWYQQGSLYDFNRPEFQISTGAFTQMIWRGTTDMGCAVNVCENGLKGERALGAAIVVICRYSPIGNLYGLFQQNVLPPKKPAVQLNTAKPQASKPSGSNSAKPQATAKPEHQQRQKAGQKLGDKLDATIEPSHPQKKIASTPPVAASQPSQLSQLSQPSQPKQQEPTSEQSAQTQSAMKFIVSAHNQYRRNHLANPLIWSDDLAAGAEIQAAKCSVSANQEQVYGQNIYASADGDAVAAVYKAPQVWYSGVGTYNYSTPGFDESTKYFSQLVWRGTTSMGCAVQECNRGITGAANKKALVVCRYSPAGNQGTASQYISNVKPGFIVKPLQPPMTTDIGSNTVSLGYQVGSAAAATPKDGTSSKLGSQEPVREAPATDAAAAAGEEVPDELLPTPAAAYTALEQAYPTIAGLLPVSMQHLLPGPTAGATVGKQASAAMPTATPPPQPHTAAAAEAAAAAASTSSPANTAAVMPTVIQMLPAPAAAASAGQVAPAVYVLVRLPAATAAAAGVTSDYVLDTLLPVIGSAGMTQPGLNVASGR